VVEVADLAIDPGIGADQVEARPQRLAVDLLPVLDQGQQRAFAVVEGDVVEIIEDARLGEFAQFGIDPAAAEDGDDLRVFGLDCLSDAEGGIDRAGEGCR